jgi:biopolymer transport protein ExbB
MAGMVGALSGVFASTWLTRNVKTVRAHLEDQIQLDRHI